MQSSMGSGSYPSRPSDLLFSHEVLMKSSPQTYFVADGTGHVKIGRSNDPTSRIKTLQTARAVQLKILLVMEGDHELELHRQFAADRVQGEWFVLSPTIQQFIALRTGIRLPFPSWLLLQQSRQDDIGRLAVIAASDKRFPRAAKRLYVFLRYYDNAPQLRQLIKQARAEWRRLHLEVDDAIADAIAG